MFLFDKLYRATEVHDFTSIDGTTFIHIVALKQRLLIFLAHFFVVVSIELLTPLGDLRKVL